MGEVTCLAFKGDLSDFFTWHGVNGCFEGEKALYGQINAFGGCFEVEFNPGFLVQFRFQRLSSHRFRKAHLARMRLGRNVLTEKNIYWFSVEMNFWWMFMR